MMRYASIIILLISVNSVGQGPEAAWRSTTGSDPAGGIADNGGTLSPSFNAKADLGSKAGAPGGGHGGSKAAEAIAAAAEAGNVARMLMMKGVLDYFQRQEMEKSLAQMGKKIDDVKAEFKSGKMTAAEYAAVKAAVDQAYTRNSKADIQLDKSVDPASKVNPKLSNQSSNNSADSGNWGVSGRSRLGAANSDANSKNQRNDLAKMDLSSEGVGAQKSSKEKSDGGGDAVTASGFPQSGIVPVVLSGGASLPTALPDSKSGEEESPLKRERVLASNGTSSSVEGATEGNHLEGAFSDSMNGSQDFQGNQMIEEELSVSDNTTSDSLITGEVSATDYNSLFERLFKPIKFQRNLLSKRLHTKEGYHPGLLLLALAGFFLLGRRIRSNRRGPTVIPELVGGPEAKPLSSAKAVAVRNLRIERRQSKRA